jgi:hypothetical protein
VKPMRHGLPIASALPDHCPTGPTADRRYPFNRGPLHVPDGPKAIGPVVVKPVWSIDHPSSLAITSNDRPVRDQQRSLTVVLTN